MDGDAALHVPPDAPVALNPVVVPIHIDDVPEMAPASGAALMVIE